MAGRVVLHIGASKTGSTYLQGVCDANRDRLAAGGVLFPAPLADHFRFMRYLLGRQNDRPPAKAARLGFERIVAAAHEYDGTVLVSNELLAAATPAQIDRVLDVVAPAEVHVVYAIRDLARTLPAEWQQAVKGGSALTLDEFVSGVMATFGEPVSSVPTIIGESQVVAKFPLLHHAGDVLGRWAADLEPGRVHVVTLAPAESDPGLLWQRFCAAAGIDPAAGAEPPRRRNESMGVAEVETLRRVNRMLGKDTGYDFASSEWVRSRFVLPLLMSRPATTRIALRDSQQAWAVDRAKDLVACLEGGGYDIVGDLRDLLPSGRPRPGVHPDDVPAAELTEIAVGWVAALLAQGWQDSRQARG
jgi:hypothetical protein